MLRKEEVLATKKKTVPGFKRGQDIAAQVRGTPEWKEWVEELAKANRVSVAGLIDMVLARFARETDFRDPPER
jgi:hypothetical protein